MKVLTKRIYLSILACIILAVSGCNSVPALIQDLGSSNSAAAEKAVQELGKRGDEAVPLVEKALSDSSPAIRMNAARALYEIEGGECAKSIVPLLIDKDDDVRAGAAAVLQKTGETGVKEIIAGAGKYDSQNYYNWGGLVISRIGVDGIAMMLEAYSVSNEPGVKRIAESMTHQSTSAKTYTNMVEIIKDKGTGDPLIISAAELFSGLNKDRFQYIYQAYGNTFNPSEKQNIIELILLMCGSVTDESVVSDMLSVMNTDNFDDVLLNIYTNTGDKGKEMLAATLRKVEQLNPWMMNSLIKDYDYKNDAEKTAIAEILSNTSISVFKDLLNAGTPEESARNLKILKAMHKQFVVENLTDLLNTKEDFGKAAECIMNLGYPEFINALLCLTIEKADNLYNLERLLRSFAADTRIDNMIKSLCAGDYVFKQDMLDSIPMENYKAGLKYKAGKGDGKQDKIVILFYDYDEFDDDFEDNVKASYELFVSGDSLSLIPADKQISFADPGNADTAVYIKTKLVKTCTYRFKSLHKYVKGYRCDYVITIVDMRTKKALGSKTLKGYKLPRLIYDNEVLWSVKRYVGESPDTDKVNAAIAALLKKYTA